MSTERNPVMLCQEDFRLLKQLVGGAVLNDMQDEMSLGYELCRAIVVKDDELPRDIIRLNSTVKVEDSESKKITELTIVMPPMADIKTKKISILTPMAAALIGFKQGDSVKWKMPSGLKTYNVLEVHNQVAHLPVS